ncbi:MAG: hypothetical protein Q8R83_10290 [Legionellaceae bacterium]|nr:hypothetical protein [Legionellaceae bacterium]
MILRKHDWFYETVLNAKINTILAAINLLQALNQVIRELPEGEDKTISQRALSEFLRGIFLADQQDKNSLDVLMAIEKLEPLKQIIPNNLESLSKNLNTCLYQQEQTEFYNYRLNLAWCWIYEILLIAAIVTICIFFPEIWVLPIYLASIAAIILLTQLLYCLLDAGFIERRASIGERSAIGSSAPCMTLAQQSLQNNNESISELSIFRQDKSTDVERKTVPSHQAATI